MAANTPHVLILDPDRGGEVLAVRFPSREAARAWEDEHDPGVVLGCFPIVTPSAALRG